MLDFYERTDKKRFTYRVVTTVMFLVAIGTLLMRIVVNLLQIDSALAVDTVFTLCVQVGILFLMPFLFYKYVLKMNFKEIMAFSNVKKTKWYYLVISIFIGVAAYVATIGISTMWQTIIILLGYTPSSSPSIYPTVFNPMIFFWEMVLTAVLPGICEEFCIRGGILTTMKGRFTYIATLWVMAVIFGLFHQSILQVFYTGCFGMLMAFLTIKTGSLLPCVVIHFVNNGLNVYMGYANAYHWVGGNFFQSISEMARSNFLGLFALYIVIVAIGAGLVLLIVYLRSKEKLDVKKEVILNSGFDHTNNRIVMQGKENQEFVEEFNLQKEVYGNRYEKKRLFKPTLKDNAFLYGALIVTVLSTLSSFIWGLMI